MIRDDFRALRGKAFMKKTLFALFLTGVLVFSVYGRTARRSKTTSKEIIAKVVSGVKDGKIAYKLTTRKELEELIGRSIREESRNSGGMEMLTVIYQGVTAEFSRMRNYSAPFTLTKIKAKRWLDIGQKREIVLRNEGDLKKFDEFWGLAGISLENLDLSGQSRFLRKMTFDSRTKWPAEDKLPRRYNPAALLEEGKTPGLGVRGLHEAGIDGRGIGIAIIDQPLLEDHEEYAERLVKYQSVEVRRKHPPQMHGSPVVSIAVGKKCGVAPGAFVHYYAVPMWKWDKNCKPWANIINQIIRDNAKLEDGKKIRVVSISLGTFSRSINVRSWERAIAKANKHGILVVTCDDAFLDYGTLQRIEGKSADDAKNYRRARRSSKRDIIHVPTSNRSVASHHGRDVYTYERDGGLSWAAPYLAGVAALGFQVYPELEPERIVELWLETASQTRAGSVINPAAFIEAVKKQRDSVTATE
ncbi:MAG: S8/S53 family peptidase [Planctomycetes bacterium]|nr:S8/S53 family peptidase [Planctomycetota bacterium]